ncbi:hypothetical protein HHK36_011388 [Tetracentron sinense]|uniref:Tubulin/FtsZ 2-layer sandwich domain-containing protein n=1 Tax=Tetracentron sinense TaxID=13715 RepID=A0A834ZBR8_TETSI|nr:hypothetical protein HHK36_011388 [Tetracentron sinense]
MKGISNFLGLSVEGHEDELRRLFQSLEVSNPGRVVKPKAKPRLSSSSERGKPLEVPGLVNVDFADVRAIMANAGSSLMGIGTATGKTRARDAALNAIQSPLLDIGIERATGIVWNITGGSDLTLFEVNAAAEVIYDLVDPSANLIFGAVIDQSLSGQVSITLIATGFKRQEEAEGRTLQGSQPAPGDVTLGINRRPSSFMEGGSVEIPEFLKKKGRSRYPRA